MDQQRIADLAGFQNDLQLGRGRNGGLDADDHFFGKAPAAFHEGAVGHYEVDLVRAIGNGLGCLFHHGACVHTACGEVDDGCDLYRRSCQFRLRLCHEGGIDADGGHMAMLRHGAGAERIDVGGGAAVIQVRQIDKGESPGGEFRLAGCISHGKPPSLSRAQASSCAQGRVWRRTWSRRGTGHGPACLRPDW